MRKQYLIVFFLLSIFPNFLKGQAVVDILPPNNINDRFYSDIANFNIQRPGLSLNGFDNGEDNRYGYGLKQILNNLYSSNPDISIKDTYEKILNKSSELIMDPFLISDHLGQVNNNSNILQSKAFVALARYV